MYTNGQVAMCAHLFVHTFVNALVLQGKTGGGEAGGHPIWDPRTPLVPIP